MKKSTKKKRGRRRILGAALTLMMMCISMLPITASAMQIFVRTQTGETVNIDIEPADMISTVKIKVFDKLGYSTDIQRLYYNEQLLEDSKTLADYNINKEAFLQLVLCCNVSLADGLSGENTAYYGTDYTGSIDNFSTSCNYTVEYTVADGEVQYATVDSETGAFTISGEYVTGELSITLTTTDNSGDFTVTTTSSGYSYDSENHKLIISGGGEYEITGTTTTDRIVIESEDDVTLTLNNVNITSSSDSPLRADKGNLTLILKGDNYLKTTASTYPGLTKESEDYTLTITSCKGDGHSEGSLTSVGAENAAGIGGGAYCKGRNITINGGTVNATGERVGIGGGLLGSAVNIVITGGIVTATGYTNAGIGGSISNDGSVTITGGMISATGGSDAITPTSITITGGYFADSSYTEGEHGTGIVYDCEVADGYIISSNTATGTKDEYPCFVAVSHTHSSYTNGFCDDCGAYEPTAQNDEGVYEISNAGQLFWFASLVSGTNAVTYNNELYLIDGVTTADTAANAILTTDIDLDGKEWTPIGTKAVPYTGTFDGNGYTISGLSITTEAEYIGLFGYIKEGTVENLTVSGAIDVSGDTIFAGGIVGTIYNGTLSNLTSYVDVTGETATKGTFGGVAATVEGTDKTAGSTMENCASYGDVTASGKLDCTGGLVGYMNSATINNCANYGAVDTTGATAQQNAGVNTGGIVGYINNKTAYITNCVNIGKVSNASSTDDMTCYTGAVVGRIRADLGGISNTYYLGTSASTGCQVNENGAELGITAKTADELASGAVTYLLQNGAGDSVWGQDLENDAYPTLYKTNVVKLTFTDGNSTVERYANVGIVPTNYPTPATGIYAFYTDSNMTNRIDTSSYIYTADTTVYMAQMYTVTQNLTNVTSNNIATEVIPGSEFTANLTVADGYVIKSVTVTMGSSDITNTAYSNGTISISNVSGDIIITAIVEVQKVSVTQNLTNVTSDNTATEAAVSSTYAANLTVADGYIIESVTVKMNGVDITSTAYSNGTISISDVSGDVVITATATKKEIKINGVVKNNNSVDVDITNTLGTSGVVIAVTYDSNGVMLDMTTTDLPTASGTVNIGIGTSSADTVSVFIWNDLITMTPLCDAYTQK